MRNKVDNYYFVSFSKLLDYSIQASNLLVKIIEDYDGTKLHSEVTEMHKVEHAADLEKHKVNENLLREFITPIEREDITLIMQLIDDVTDSIEDVLLKLYMYNVQEMKSEVHAFVKVINSCIAGLSEVLKEFYNFKKSTVIKEKIIEVNRFEEIGDRLYTEAIRKLFVESKDPVYLLIWNDVFLQLEKCCDACENVAEAIESVIMKNS
jgi:hypothetical protein